MRALFLLTWLFTGLALAATPPAKAPRVAVLYFDYDGETVALAGLKKGLAQMLITDLSATGVTVVERARLQEVLAELQLQKSGAVDAASAARVGKLLGASHLVMGGYYDLGGQLRVDARVVETETGKILKGVSAAGKVDDFASLQNKLSQDLGTALNTLVRADRSEPKPAKRGPASGAKSTSTGTVTPAAGPVPGSSAPRGLTVEVASAFGRGLDALDAGDLKLARTELEFALAARPDFTLAKDALRSLPN